VTRAFFLAGDPDAEPPALLEEEQVHARRVLRLGVGDALIGLDGRGGRWPLVVRDTTGGRFEVELRGSPERDPPPGAAGAPLPWIEVAVALPREKRAEAMLERLTQLGLASLAPLLAERSQGSQRALSDGRRRRLERVAREACKQCGRSWVPEIEAPRTLEAWLERRAGAAIAVLDPRAGGRLAAWAAEVGRAGARERPLALLVGPEGGFSEAELEGAQRAGARPVRLGPHVLRIETAAEAALAGLVQALAT